MPAESKEEDPWDGQEDAEGQRQEREFLRSEDNRDEHRVREDDELGEHVDEEESDRSLHCGTESAAWERQERPLGENRREL